MLMNEGLWKIVTGEETEPNDKGQRAKFATRRDRALATVVLSVDPSILYIIGNPEDPVVVWKKLVNQYEKKTLFVRHAVPFCPGVFGVVSSWRTPSVFRYASNSEEVNSPPLSVRSIFKVSLLSFSTNFFKSKNFSKT